MWRILLVGSLLAACGGDDARNMDGDGELTLVAAPGQNVHQTVGPYVFGLGYIHVHLDLHAMDRNYVSVTTDSLPGTATGISLHVDDTDGAMLMMGGDITVGESDPHTYMIAAREFPRSVRDVVVVIGAENVTTSITIGVTDPLE